MDKILINKKICWLDTEKALTDEELKLFYNENRINSIKAKASEIILNKYSVIWQLNHPRTDATYTNEYAWIDNIRAISNKAESDGIDLENINWN